MDYFDYSSEGYGKPEVPIEDYIFFLHIEATHVGGFAELEMYLYYRVTDDRILEFVMGTDSFETESGYIVIGKFQLKEPFFRRHLIEYIKRFIKNGRNYLSLGYIFHGSPFITESQFDNILDDIVADLKINRYHIQTRWKDSTLVKVCKKNDFEVIPTPVYDHIAECRCPSGYSHRLTMNLENGTWGCGWCGKKGDSKDLEMFFQLCGYNSPATEDNVDLILNSTSKTPLVRFMSSGSLYIGGRSISEEGLLFYMKISDWIHAFKPKNKIVEFKMEFEYLNEITAKLLVKDIKILKAKCNELRIRWIYDYFDEDLLDVGKAMSESVDLPFEFIPKG